MLNLWSRPKKTPTLKSDLSIRAIRPVIPRLETFLERARRNDTDGEQRRLRQVVDQNRLL